MSVVLSEHLALLVSAPEGIQKLRGLIRELAVRGKLVPQDPDDEPASELLKRIAVEKAQLAAMGKIKKEKASLQVGEDERSFSVPVCWEWIRLTEALAVVTDGDHQPPPKADSGVPFLVIGNLNSGLVSFDGCRFVPEHYFEDLHWSKRPTSGDLLYTVTGSFGIAVPVSTNAPFCVQRHVAILKTVRSSPASYLLKYLQSLSAKLFSQAVATGTAQRTVPLTGLRQMPIPLPPLAEQHRIVAKVDELMALCDRLETEQADAASAHARLVETLLGTLTQSTAAADLAANWQRLAEHFDTLFTTEASIDALKQTVLQLAVMGKLVPQESTCSDEMTCFEGDVLPTGWRIESINEFCNVQGGIQKTPLRRPVKNHYPYLRVANVQRGSINTDELARYELTAEELVRWRLDAGDLLIVEGNGSESEIGRCAVWRGQIPDCVYQNHLIRVRPHVPEQVDYLQLFLNSPVGIGHMKRLAITTSGLFNLSVGKIRGIEVPLPPLAEQHRIVAKVDELMALCDRLKADLATARQHQAALADTLIDAALEAA